MRWSRALQAQQHELERQRITDNLKKGLKQRPEKEELVERNILPDSTAAPALQGQQKELAKHMRKNSLEKQLANRPRPEELIREGILEGELLEPFIVVLCAASWVDVLTCMIFQRMRIHWPRLDGRKSKNKLYSELGKGRSLLIPTFHVDFAESIFMLEHTPL